jgi:hypothetical protein
VSNLGERIIAEELQRLGMVLSADLILRLKTDRNKLAQRFRAESTFP